MIAVTSEFLAALNMKIAAVFRDMTPCSLVDIHKRFAGIFYSIFSTSKEETECSSEKFVSTYQTTGRHTPKTVILEYDSSTESS
jgi:hypothetical protein